jgi:hypothetical protein
MEKTIKVNMIALSLMFAGSQKWIALILVAGRGINMRDYQPKKIDKYVLPYNLYGRVLRIIRDYERLKNEYHDTLNTIQRPAFSEIKKVRVDDPTCRQAMKLSVISNELQAVEQSLMSVPHEYRGGVWDNALHGAPYPHDADKRTYGTWKQRFVYGVARNLYYI